MDTAKAPYSWPSCIPRGFARNLPSTNGSFARSREGAKDAKERGCLQPRERRQPRSVFPAPLRPCGKPFRIIGPPCGSEGRLPLHQAEELRAKPRGSEGTGLFTTTRATGTTIGLPCAPAPLRETFPYHRSPLRFRGPSPASPSRGTPREAARERRNRAVHNHQSDGNNDRSSLRPCAPAGNPDDARHRLSCMHFRNAALTLQAPSSYLPRAVVLEPTVPNQSTLGGSQIRALLGRLQSMASATRLPKFSAETKLLPSTET